MEDQGTVVHVVRVTVGYSTDRSAIGQIVWYSDVRGMDGRGGGCRNNPYRIRIPDVAQLQ